MTVLADGSPLGGWHRRASSGNFMVPGLVTLGTEEIIAPCKHNNFGDIHVP